MKYLTQTSYVTVIGKIWMPSVVCSQRIELDRFAVDNIIGYSNRFNTDDRTITREGLELWLGCHAGDFADIIDFEASIEHPDTDETVDIAWENDDSEAIYGDTLSEDDF
jgi:hypothetical protein